VNAGIGIITLCDANYFPGLLMLHQSVQESFPCTVACYDLGLTPEQAAAAERLENLILLPLPNEPLIERLRAVTSRAPRLAKLYKRVWPLWICPLLIKHAPFRDVIWMDCDLVVLRNLRDLFAAIERGPVFTPENKAPQCTHNSPALYDLLPIARQFDRMLPTVNAGVSAWRKARDSAVIDAYLHVVERAAVDERIREAISWHDQGALIWAIQSLGLEHRVASSTVWNLCVDNTALARRPLPWNEDFLRAAREAVGDANILHWNGCPPAWMNALA
jgi:hypothetical protein